MAATKAQQIPTAAMKLMVKMMGYSRAASSAEMTVDVTVRMKDCWLGLSSAE